MASMVQPPRFDSSKSKDNSLENFIKVGIRSATLNMKKGDHLYILLSLKKGDHEMLVRTKLATRNTNSNPEWNQTFVFSVPKGSIMDLDFTISCKIVKTRKFLPDYVLGEAGSEISYLFPVGAAREEEVFEPPHYDIPDPLEIFFDTYHDFYNHNEHEDEEKDDEAEQEFFKLKAHVDLPIMKGTSGTTIGELSAVFTAWWAKKSPCVAAGDGAGKGNSKVLSAEIFRDASFRLGTLKMERRDKMNGIRLVGGAQWRELAMDSEELKMTATHDGQSKKLPKFHRINCFACTVVKD